MILRLDAIDVFSNNAMSLSIEDGYLSSSEAIEKRAGMPYFCPGLIDVQINGNLGIDYSGEELSFEEILTICRSVAERGTLQHFPTIVTRPESTIERNLAIIARSVRQNSLIASEITGIHVEGPYISPVDGPRGAHDLRYVRKPSIKELDRWIDCSEGLLKIVTIAPEIEGACEFIEYATRKGIVCSIGHCQPTGDQVDAAVKAGARVCTHLGNGSAAMLDRLSNHIISILANDSIAVTLIADGAHLPPRAVNVFSKCRNEDDVVIITDLAPMAGMPKGVMNWGNMTVEIVEDGSVRLAGTPYLAGAGSPLIRNIGNYVRYTGKKLQAAVKACTFNPTRIYGLDADRMGLCVGRKADFIVFDWDEKSSIANINRVVQGGIQ
ncbi:MAG: amidohydrolase family protein [Candidatus Cloacimonetes bacterium]|nr:amidohydrolase family protein [Candidatus Cloacimonadota bacterium]